MSPPLPPEVDCDRQHPSFAVPDVPAAVEFYTSKCLEETLLHTLDGVGPHTRGDLRHIQTLKAKHGIDYDSHASYRFVER